nr:MAG TPA: hypothetical protein [Caudoviricetes sp.]
MCRCFHNHFTLLLERLQISGLSTFLLAIIILSLVYH